MAGAAGAAPPQPNEARAPEPRAKPASEAPPRTPRPNPILVSRFSGAGTWNGVRP